MVQQLTARGRHEAKDGTTWSSFPATKLELWCTTFIFYHLHIENASEMRLRHNCISDGRIREKRPAKSCRTQEYSTLRTPEWLAKWYAVGIRPPHRRGLVVQVLLMQSRRPRPEWCGSPSCVLDCSMDRVLPTRHGQRKNNAKRQY